VINLSIKPGTNKVHGAAYEYLRRTSLTANTYANNANRQVRPNRLQDQYGFELDGPVYLPKLYHGRDKTFFMVAYERYRDVQPQPGLGSVPTPEQRAGDFSQTLVSAGRVSTIYDPLTIAPHPAFDATKAVSLTNLQYLRTPFAGNRIPSQRFNPVALKVLGDVPLPNQAGDSVTRLNNWFAGDANSATDYYNVISRVDHNIGDRFRIYARWNRMFRDGGKKNAYSWTSPAKQYSHSGRNNDAAMIDTVATLSPRTVLSARIGFNRYVYSSIYGYQDLSYLGIPVTSQLQLPGKYPMISWENYIGTSVNDNDYSPSENWSAQGSLLKIAGAHFLKFGAEYRMMRYADVGVQNGGGTYSFTRGWTSSNPQVDDRNTGNAIASFLLGDLSAATAPLNASPYLVWKYPVFYFQDDWKASSRLTFNLGLRWDYEAPVVERYNRQNRGFDATVKSPITVPGYDLRGGLLFAGVGGLSRGAFNSTLNTWQPRVGVAYKLSQKRPLVFRGGVGRYFLPTMVNSGIYDFPVGPHKKWLNHGLASYIVGGWTVDGMMIAQSGIPVGWSSGYYIYGDPKLSSGQNLNHWFNTSPSIWALQPTDTLRTAKLRSPTVRSYYRPQYDATLIRNFKIKEGHQVQFKVSSFNLTNTPIFGPPNTSPSSSLFGVIPVTQINLPRDIELGFRYSF
jgi:hypothetical protein